MGKWIHNQRYCHNNEKSLSHIQIERLESIGMIWKPLKERWLLGYTYAKKYYEEHDDIELPATYVWEDGFKLGEWIRQ